MPAAPEADLDRDVNGLYDLPLAEFVPARDALAKRARAEGQGDLAMRVKGLRKPTVAAWIVNRLARERELDVQRLLKAGEALAEAQVEATEGSADAFAKARREEQRALERLGEAAREIVEREGVGAGVLDRIARTLHAGSLTEEGRELLKQGRLTEELQPPGFEALAGLPSAPRARPERKASADGRAERRKAIAEARQQVRALRGEEREVSKAAAAAEREAERAERQAAALREAAERARTEAEKAAEARAAAEQELGRLEA